jgi:raffinose/stachyose/melibiose transport system permease protein
LPTDTLIDNQANGETKQDTYATTSGREPGRAPQGAAGWLWVLPALGLYVAFVIYPLTQTVRYSFYDWDGIGPARWVGLGNYREVLTDHRLLGSIIHALVLMLFFTVLPIILGLATAVIVEGLRTPRLRTIARVTLFLPQIVPLAGAGITWQWMYSSDGGINQVLRGLGVGALARPWLADFSTALPAVGLIGTWVATGLCTLLFTAALQRQDPSLLEAAALDGAGRLRTFHVITLPALRREIVTAATVLTIAALASFDIVYVATAGGPGYATTVPGVLIFRLVFTEQAIGLASALAVVLVALVLAIVVPLQRLAVKE